MVFGKQEAYERVKEQLLYYGNQAVAPDGTLYHVTYYPPATTTTVWNQIHYFDDGWSGIIDDANEKRSMYRGLEPLPNEFNDIPLRVLSGEFDKKEDNEPAR